MKIAIPASSDNLESLLDPRFGRCPYFIIVNSETGGFEAIANPATGAMGGAGVQAAQLVANKGVAAVLANNIGPNAFRALAAGNIKIYGGATGTVKEAIEQFNSGQLKEITGPTTPGRFG